MRPLRHRQEGSCSEQDSQTRQVLYQGCESSAWRPCGARGHSVHGRGILIPQVCKGQPQQSCADKGRTRLCERDLPYPAPERLPFQSETLHQEIQGCLVQISEQLSCLEQRDRAQGRGTLRESEYDPQTDSVNPLRGDLPVPAQESCPADISGKSVIIAT